MIGQTISHYEILERLGEGGMGVVYKARDRNLDRFVALKVLSPRTDDSPEDVTRFEQEAKTISALNHPHIATIHDRGEVDGKPYLVLEFLPGGTLREKLRKRRQEGKHLSLDEVIRHALEAAEGLAHAHRRGVVHRDVKTDNFMLTEEGYVKVTDFGLAKWVAGARLTSEGKALGTAAYMAPEQAQGGEADQRSDIFSFGVVLYELIAGETPFREMYPAAVIYDIVNTPTPSVRQVRSEAPQALDEIIQKATSKDPKDRYQHMDALLSDLQSLCEGISSGHPVLAAAAKRTRPTAHARWAMAALVAILVAGSVYWAARTEHPERPTAAPVASQAEPISIAVLPLQNLSSDPEKDYLAEGMTESLITDLAKIPSLRVISRTSVMQYKQTRKPLQQIAEELGVNRIVEGTVLQVGKEIRITAQLIDAHNDEHLWADSYQRNVSDVLALQQEVSGSIASEVASQLRAGAVAVAARPVNPEAYEAFLRGNYHSYRWNPEDLRKGVTYYQRAIELDPNYGSAYAGLSAAYGFMALFGGAAPGEAWPLARAAAERALAIDETLGEAHTSLGFVQATYDWNWLGAEREYQRALKLNPNSSMAHHAYAMTCLAPLGRLDEALAEIKQARDLDPLSLAINANLADIRKFRGEYKEAVEQYKRTLELDPSFAGAYGGLASAYLAQGKKREATEAFEKSAALFGEGDRFLPVLLQALSGDQEGARRKLGELEKLREQRYVCACRIGSVYALMGDEDVAFSWLERAYQERSGSLLLLKVNPFFESLRSDPRFESLLRRMNLANDAPKT